MRAADDPTAASPANPRDPPPRELREEFGGVCRALRPIGTYFASNGVNGERIRLSFALGPTLRANASERIAQPRVALRMARAGEISDGPSALALLLVEPSLAPR